MPESLVVLVSGRGALATLAGVPSVVRHVLAGRRLGMDVVVVYPPERKALGAEIRGLVEGDATCLSADGFAARPSSASTSNSVRSSSTSDSVVVVAAEWYLSLAALASLREQPESRVLGRVCERGTLSVPIARVTLREAVVVARGLADQSAAAALAELEDDDIAVLDLDPRSEQRLSDNVSTVHAEGKLVETLFGPDHPLAVLRVRRAAAPALARQLAHTDLGPAGISAAKLLLGLLAAWILEGGSYAEGLFGASLYFLARVLGASGVVLARANFEDSGIRERLDLAGDTVLHIALLWSLAGGPAQGPGAPLLAAVATAGVLASTAVAYLFVLRGHWATPRRTDGAGDEFVSRFVQRDGIAYALLFAAATGQLDLFLWAAAIASHLFYIFWLLARPRGTGRTMAFGRPA